MSKPFTFKTRLSLKPFLWKMSFIYMRIKNHFHIKSFALSLALKPRLPTTQNSLLFASINDLSNVHWNDILSSGKNNVDVLFSSLLITSSTQLSINMLSWKNYLVAKKSALQALDYHWIKGIYKDEKQTLRIGRWV